MRVHFYLITDHPDDEKIGLIETVEGGQKNTGASKNEEGVCYLFNHETGDRKEQWEVGLGYVDFEDENDYEENLPEAVDRKLAEIDAEYLEKAGHDPEGVAA